MVRGRDRTRRSWARVGSNHRPSDYESPALTTELRARCRSRVARQRARYRIVCGGGGCQDAVVERFTMPRGLVDDVCSALSVSLPTNRADVAALYRAWCEAVPFDPVVKALAMVEGRTPPGDDPVEVAERWLHVGLGSTCWGHVTVLGGILETAGMRVTAGVDRMLRDDIVDFHAFLVVHDGGEAWVLDPIHPSGDLLLLDAGARGTHPEYEVRFDDVRGRLVHWCAPRHEDARVSRYVVLSTTLDRADVRAFCEVSAQHSGVGRRFFQRRIPADAFVTARPTEDGAALAITTWREGRTDVMTIDDVDEAIAAVGYQPPAREWLLRAELLTNGAAAPWKA